MYLAAHALPAIRKPLPTPAASPDAHHVPLAPLYPCRLRSQIGTPLADYRQARP